MAAFPLREGAPALTGPAPGDVSATMLGETWGREPVSRCAASGRGHAEPAPPATTGAPCRTKATAKRIQDNLPGAQLRHPAGTDHLCHRKAAARCPAAFRAEEPIAEVAIHGLGPLQVGRIEAIVLRVIGPAGIPQEAGARVPRARRSWLCQSFPPQ